MRSPYRRSRTILIALLAIAVATSHSPAHDYWLEPDAFLTRSGDRVAVRLFVGEHLTSEAERPLQKERTVRFVAFSKGGELDLLATGRDGESPVARFTPSAGGNLLAMERRPAEIKLDAAKFTAYLKEEGLDAVIADREKRGESQKEGRERYRRYLKTLIRSGGSGDDLSGVAAGHVLEVVPLSNPSRLRPGDKLGVRVAFEGKPLAGARVFAENRDAGVVRSEAATTDAEGLATFAIARPGTWLIRLVQMRRAAPGGEIDWESHWAAYTFGVQAP
jgi:uncharacterized GH25 family protein